MSAIKVAYIMSHFPKLTETFVLYEMLALEELGFQVDIYPLLRSRQRVAHPEAQRLVRRAHFQPFLSPATVRAQWHFLRRQPRLYLQLLADLMGETWGSANFCLGALAIFPKAVAFAYDMANAGITHIHAHFANHPAVAAFIIHRLTGIPFSFTAHAHDLYVERRMLAAKVKAAAFAVTISAYNKALMVETCGPHTATTIHIIHCGVDPDVFAPHAVARSNGPLQILCVGALEEKKGHRYLIDACRVLQARGVSFVCHVVGAGPARRQLEAHIARAGLSDRMHLHGAQPRPEVARLLAEADVFALASVPTRRGQREGIPVVLMEAMASGLPVVASALSGIPELVDSGRTGFLVPPRDVTALADALHTLHNDAQLRQQMGQAGRKKVQHEFDLRVNTAALATLFLAAQRHNGRPRAGGHGHASGRERGTLHSEKTSPEESSRRLRRHPEMMKNQDSHCALSFS